MMQAPNLPPSPRCDGTKVCVLPLGDFLGTYLRISYEAGEQTGDITNIEHYANREAALRGGFEYLLGDGWVLTPTQEVVLWAQIDAIERAKKVAA